MLVGESRQPVGLAALLSLRRRRSLQLQGLCCCHLPTVGSRLRGFALLVILLLPPTGVSSRSSWSLRGDFASCADPNLRLHGGVGRGVLVRCDQQLIEGLRLIAEELVLEEGAFSAPGRKVLDGLHLVHALAGVPEFSPARELVASRLVRALHTQGHLAWLGRSLVRFREVADKSLEKVNPTVDAARL